MKGISSQTLETWNTPTVTDMRKDLLAPTPPSTPHQDSTPPVTTPSRAGQLAQKRCSTIKFKAHSNIGGKRKMLHGKVISLKLNCRRVILRAPSKGQKVKFVFKFFNLNFNLI